jgi:DNA-directed RNA polymerase, mitochondrial
MSNALLEKLVEVGVGGLAPAKKPQIKDTGRYAEQIALEEYMVSEGVNRYNKAKDENKKGERESNTAYGLHILKSHIEPLSNAIKKGVEDAFSGTVGKKHSAMPLLIQIVDNAGEFNPDIVAYIGLRSILDSITMKWTLQKASLRIGACLQDEVNFTAFKQELPHTYDKVRRDLKQRTQNYHHKKYSLERAMKNKDMKLEDWEHNKAQLGLWVIGKIIEATGLIDVKLLKENRKKAMKYVVANEKTIKWINAKNERQELLTPLFFPTIIKPAKWLHPFKGGYHGKTRQQTFIKTRNNGYLEDISNKVDEMKSLYEAVNTIQETAWVINKPVLDVMQNMWDKEIHTKELPQTSNLPLPPKPVNFDETTKEGKAKFKAWRLAHKIEWQNWKHSAMKVHQANTRNHSKVIQVQKVLFLAQKFRDQKEIFFPHQLDFRGRCYPLPMFLQPQGAPYSRALLKFKNSHRMGDDPSSGGWLAVHGATMYGKDKLTYDERIQFIQDNEQNIIDSATNPYENTWWMEAGDSPFGFLGFCYEWKGFLEQGDNFRTSLPIALDGTCNGLQIFSLLLKDEEGGKAVNLLPSEKPEDIYRNVSDKVFEHLKNETDETIYLEYKSKKDLAKDWLDMDCINRKITKRPVMIVPYSGTLFACRNYIEEFLDDLKEDGIRHKWTQYNKEGKMEERLLPPTQYLANIIWDKINETIPKAREGMTWFKKIARIIARQNLPIRWTTPMGFPVLQCYRSVRSRRVETKMGDSIVKLSFAQETQNIDRQRQSAGISPNFIHGLDACAMLSTVNEMKKMGIHDFAMIHDSYGTNAVYVSKMSEALRKVFHEMFQENLMQQFLDEALEIIETIEDPEERRRAYEEVPPMPAMGSLNIDDLLNSEYFFS